MLDRNRVTLALAGMFVTVASAQMLPCWGTVNTGTEACNFWPWPPETCDVTYNISMQLYRADPASMGFKEPVVHYAECSGTYYTRNAEGECIEAHPFVWQTSGTQGGNGGCPSPPGGS